jgi:hypothetical protein
LQKTYFIFVYYNYLELENQEINIKKYPKSKNGFQCLGPCYHPGTMIVHPTLLETATDRYGAFCPVNAWEGEDPQTGQKTYNITDACFGPTKKENISNKELGLNILTPYIDFDSGQFLKIYYNIYSFEDAMDWLDRNKHTPLDTQLRIINCSLKSFGKSIDLVDNRFIDFIVNAIKMKYAKIIYSRVAKYIGVDINDKKSHGNPVEEITLVSENKLSNTEYSVERMNYMIKIFLNRDEINKFVVRFFKSRKDKWENIVDFINFMVVDLAEYINNKIEVTLKQK